jgi:P27 family predicted phage terminase small subunit
MARPREPIDLIKAKGKKNLSKKEYEERKESEVDVPFVDVKPPKYLKGKKRINEFNHYAGMLLKIGIFTELDVDVLAKYIIAKELYIQYTKQLEEVVSKSVIVDKWTELNSIVFNDEDEATLRDLLERILRRQKGDDTTVLMNLQDKAFKQCLACAKELGLGISSRCKLVVPPPPDDDDEL